MIRVKCGIGGVNNTVTRNVVNRVCEDFIRFLGFNHDIYYTIDDKEPVDRYKERTGSIESYSSPQQEKMSITYEDIQSPDHELSLKYIRPDYEPIYKDVEIGSNIKAVYLRRRLMVVFKYMNKSKAAIEQIVNNIRLMPSESDGYITHDLTYHYQLPSFAFSLVNEINNKKNTRLDTPLSIHEYINKTFDSRVDMVNTPDGDGLKSNIAIREKQLNAMGHIEDNMSDITIMDSEDDLGYSVEFNYALDYDMPVRLLLTYPVMIYNQTIDPKFLIMLPNNNTMYKGIYNKSVQGLMDGVSGGVGDVFKIPRDSYYIHIPSDDIFVLPRPDPFYVRILSVTNIIDMNNKKLLFNIEDIPDITFKEPILEMWRKSEYPYLNNVYESMFYIELFKDGYRDDENTIIIDSDLNMSTSLDMDPKCTYRIVINLLTNINILNNNNRSRISNYLATEDEEHNISRYYLEVLNIDSGMLDTCNNDIEVISRINAGEWLKFYTQQYVLNILKIMKRK